MSTEALVYALEAEAERRNLVQAIEAEAARRSPNGRAAKSAVMRAALLQGVANWVVSRQKAAFEELEKGLAEDVRAAEPVASRLSWLFAAAEQRIRKAFQAVLSDVQARCQEVAEAVAEKVRREIEQHHKVKTAGKTVNHLGSVVMGAPLSEHFDKLAADALFRFKAAVRSGLKAGDDTERLVERIEGSEVQATAHTCDRIVKAVEAEGLDLFSRLLGTSELSVEKVVQAAVQAFAHEGEYQAGDEAEPEEKRVGWRWLAVLDERTCERCQFYDGSTWDREFEPVGGGPEFPDDPPVHFNCRCTLVPVDLDEPASAPQSFEDYLDQFSRSEQEQMFGKAELRRYRRGDITAGQLVGGRENMVTLEQFKAAQAGGKEEE